MPQNPVGNEASFEMTIGASGGGDSINVIPQDTPNTTPSSLSPKVDGIAAPDGANGYLDEALTVFVIGASGDLAKKKTYPSLYDLYVNGFLPEKTVICGYARSKKTDEEFRARIGSALEKKGGTDADKEAFLKLCIYRNGAYDSPEAVGGVFEELKDLEAASGRPRANRLFYFAIPPNVFVPIGKSLKEAVVGPQEDAGGDMGWSRLVIEKPFGKDSDSFEDLNGAMSALYSEDYLYRIDHYLGKEMVKNLLVLRFSNVIFEPLWNRDHVSSVTISFKEDFGTKGRGGYFDGYGIIRDILQNHLLQVLSLVAMEPPVAVSGEGYANYVRNEKVNVLNCIEVAEMNNAVLGQYMAAEDGSEVKYTDDPTVPDDSVTPTFAAIVLYINNPRWDGVPFILKAGKALNERKAEIRIQFKKPPGADMMFPDEPIPTSELVIRLQPDEAAYMKVNVKEPGLSNRPVASELDLSYKTRYEGAHMFDAYTRLLLDVLRGSQATFVRDDELRAAWKIFTPLLHQIEREGVRPIPYEYGGRGPKEADELLARVGFQHQEGEYKWRKPSSEGQTDAENKTIPDKTIPDKTIPDETIPDETIPDETIPGKTIPDETISEQAAPLDPKKDAKREAEAAPMDRCACTIF